MSDWQFNYNWAYNCVVVFPLKNLSAICSKTMGTTCTKCWHRHTSVVEHGLEKFFGKWGLFVANYPLITIIISTIFATILSLFITNIETETTIQNLFAPKGTTSYNNYIKYLDTWDQYEDSLGYNAIIVYDKNDPNKNIFTLEYLTLFQQLYDKIISFEVEYDNIKYSYNDICYRYENGNCATPSILQMFMYNQSQLSSEFDSTYITYPAPYSSWSNNVLFMPLVLGENITTEIVDISSSSSSNTPSPTIPTNGVQTTQFFSTTPEPENNIITAQYAAVITGSPAFRMTFIVDIGYYGDEICELWYKEWIKTVKEFGEDEEVNTLFEVAYEGYLSFEEELTRAVASDISSFVISIVLLSIFSTLVIVRCKRLPANELEDSKCACFPFRFDDTRNRSRIGWIGLISCILAVGSSFGLVGGLVGIKFNSVVSISPFLLVGLGCMWFIIFYILLSILCELEIKLFFGLFFIYSVDDMFVILRAYELTSPLLTIQERIKLTMERGGVSIMFTSITDLVAFCVGSTSSLSFFFVIAMNVLPQSV